MKRRTLLLRMAGAASVATALVLTLVKAFAWWLTGSASVLASLLDSVMDLVSSTVNALALGYATRPADANHRFGHDKAEALAAYTQALLLVGSASGILYYAASRLGTGTVAMIENTLLGAGLMALVLVLTAMLVAFQFWVTQRTGSALVAADSVHYRSDFLINASVIGTLWLAGTLPWLDAVMAVIIACYVYFAAWGILRRAVNELLDRELPAVDDHQLLALAHAHPAVLGVHDLKTRRAGGRVFVQLHLEFGGQTPLHRAHEAGLQVRRGILERYPEAEVLVHMDPVATGPLEPAPEH